MSPSQKTRPLTAWKRQQQWPPLDSAQLYQEVIFVCLCRLASQEIPFFPPEFPSDLNIPSPGLRAGSLPPCRFPVAASSARGCPGLVRKA